MPGMIQISSMHCTTCFVVDGHIISISYVNAKKLLLGQAQSQVLPHFCNYLKPKFILRHNLKPTANPRNTNYIAPGKYSCNEYEMSLVLVWCSVLYWFLTMCMFYPLGRTLVCGLWISPSNLLFVLWGDRIFRTGVLLVSFLVCMLRS